jgi:hypothetical protein
MNQTNSRRAFRVGDFITPHRAEDGDRSSGCADWGMPAQAKKK